MPVWSTRPSSSKACYWNSFSDPDRDSSLDTLSSYGTEAVANSIARSGGLGIARKLIADVDRIDPRGDSQTQKFQRSQAAHVTQVIR